MPEHFEVGFEKILNQKYLKMLENYNNLHQTCSDYTVHTTWWNHTWENPWKTLWKILIYTGRSEMIAS